MVSFRDVGSSGRTAFQWSRGMPLATRLNWRPRLASICSAVRFECRSQVPRRLARVRTAPSRLVPLRSAPWRLASVKLALVRFPSTSSQHWRWAPVRFALVRSMYQ